MLLNFATFSLGWCNINEVIFGWESDILIFFQLLVYKIFHTSEEIELYARGSKLPKHKYFRISERTKARYSSLINAFIFTATCATVDVARGIFFVCTTCVTAAIGVADWCYRAFLSIIFRLSCIQPSAIREHTCHNTGFALFIRGRFPRTCNSRARYVHFDDDSLIHGTSVSLSLQTKRSLSLPRT